MKVVGVDNHNRESVADVLVAENVKPQMAEKIADLLNEDSKIGDMAGTFYRAVADDYRLSRGMEDLI